MTVRQLAAVAALALAACAAPSPAPVATIPSSTPPGVTAAPAAACPPCNCPVCPGPVTPPEPAKPLQPAAWADLPDWPADDLGAALAAFLQSCRSLKPEPWRATCEEALRLAGADGAALRAFFERRFQPWQVANADNSREGLITGYYEPLLKGSRRPSARFSHPIYGVPDDLLVVDLSELHPQLKSLRLRGRLEGRKVVPYYTRAELGGRAGALADKVLYWAADPIEAFFLQVQGSGRVELPDGSRVRLGYADQNGHPYVSIGRWLVERGELKVEEASMEGIRAWARANPARLAELLEANPSFVFFRELPPAANGAEGPLGAMGIPVTPGRSLAVDPRSIPLGAPVWLATTLPGTDRPLRRLMTAQDTGGAIKGGVRADFFWGFGAEAGAQAGRMRQQGQMWVLLPREMAP